MALWSLKDKSILIVDDFPEMRSLIRSMVTAFGAQQIHLAIDGEEAVDAMAARRFDIVLCDYNLGDGKDGQQVLEEASHRGLLPHSTVFVMVTAENTSQMVMGALEHQPDGYIAKPVTKTVLQARLQKMLAKKETLSDIKRALDRKQFSEALECCDRHIAANSKYRFELLKIKSDVLIRTGDYDGASTLCDTVLAERELPWALFDLGRSHYHRSRHQDAAEVFSRVIEINNAFVSAYDWLAKTQQQLGDHAAAQRTLMDAIEKSSKSLPRLRALAAAADRNEDGAVTEQARRKAIRVGKGSVLRRPSDYTGLARTLLKNDSGKDALKTIDLIKYEFRGNPQAELEAAAVGSTIHAALGNEKPGQALLETAMTLASAHPEFLDADAGVDLVQACLAHDRQEQASEFVRAIVRNNHDDEEALGRISDLYESMGILDDISSVIENTRKEIVRINNEGVRLLKDGKIRESMELFSEAAKGMPRNPIINLNAAQSLISMMKSSQPTKPALEETLSYIRAADNSESHKERQSRLLADCRELSACL